MSPFQGLVICSTYDTGHRPVLLNVAPFRAYSYVELTLNSNVRRSEIELHRKLHNTRISCERRNSAHSRACPIALRQSELCVIERIENFPSKLKAAILA